MRNTPTELVLLQIAEGLKSLIKNPDISEIVRKTYTLSEEEKAKAEEARLYMAQVDGIRKQIDSDKAKYDDVLQRIARAEALEAFNEDTLKTISKRSQELDAKEKANTDA